jgi:hypothetical protein
MGMTEIRVRIVNLADPRRAADVDMVVDSGAIYSIVPAAVLRRIGVAPRDVQNFGLANGGTARRAIGDVRYARAQRRSSSGGPATRAFSASSRSKHSDFGSTRCGVRCSR